MQLNSILLENGVRDYYIEEPVLACSQREPGAVQPDARLKEPADAHES